MSYKKGFLFIKQKSSKMFLFAFLVSITTWLLINLSKIYEKSIVVNVSYAHLEKGSFVKSSDSILKVTIKGSGFSLLSNELTGVILNIDTDKVKEEWNWEYNDSDLNALFPKSISVVNASPKKISFVIKERSKKQVPILSQLKITSKLGYGITSKSLSKDSVFIFGDEISIDSISHIKTERLVFDNRTEPISGKAKLEYQNKGIQIENKEVAYLYHIEQFTQGDFAVKINVKNIPENKKVTVFPKEVHVQFQGALSKYSAYKANDFSIYVDVDDANDTNTLPIYIANVPNDVKNVRVLKKSVTYLVLEK